MASITFKRGTKAEIESTQIQDGQLLMETDQLNNNKIYLDLPNGTRVPIGGSGAWVGTKKEFELAVEEGKIADGTQVIITDDYESGITASMTLYSNSQSGLVATNVQSAIDELNSAIDTSNSAINTLNSDVDTLNSAIDTLNSNLAEMFVVERYKATSTINCPANSFTEKMTISIAKEGYTPILATPVSSGRSQCSISFCYLQTDNTVEVRCINVTSSAYTVQPTIDVLYRKS